MRQNLAHNIRNIFSFKFCHPTKENAVCIHYTMDRNFVSFITQEWNCKLLNSRSFNYCTCAMSSSTSFLWRAAYMTKCHVTEKCLVCMQLSIVCAPSNVYLLDWTLYHTALCLTVVSFSSLMDDTLGATRVSKDEEEDEDPTAPCCCGRPADLPLCCWP